MGDVPVSPFGKTCGTEISIVHVGTFAGPSGSCKPSIAFILNGCRSMGIWHWIVGNWLTDNGTVASRAASNHRREKKSTAGVVTLADTPTPTSSQLADRWWMIEGAALTEPVEIERPELTTEARTLENLLVSQFDGHNLSLPPLAHAAETLLPKLASPKCDLRSIARELGEDQVIAAAVLRMANSVLFRGLDRISALPPAVSRLGTSALRMLLMNETLRTATFFQKGGNNDWAKSIWRRSLASGFIMRGLAQFTNVDQEDAFLVGLLHDIGNVVVLRVVCEAQSIYEYDITTEEFEYLCHECHQEFGELIAQSWSLPAHLKSIITNHHTIAAVDDPLRAQRDMIELTGLLNSIMGFAPYADYNLIESRSARALQLTERDDFIAFLEQLPEEVDDVVNVL